MARWSKSASQAGIVLANVALLALVTRCSSGDPTDECRPQPIVGWSGGGDVQSGVIGACDGDPIPTAEKDGETVNITVASTLRSARDACQDSLQIALPLGEGDVIDGVTGAPPAGIEG